MLLGVMAFTCLLAGESAFATRADARLRTVTQGDPGDGDLAPQPSPSKGSSGSAVVVRTTAATATTPQIAHVVRNNWWQVTWTLVSRLLRMSLR